MPLHNHLISFNDPLEQQSTRDATSTPRTEPPPFESDPLLPKSEHVHPESETRILTYACILTTFFFLVELAGGYVAGSLAIMSDAAHLLSDLAGFAISLLAVAVSRLPANPHMSFGFARAEVLGAFVSILFIWALTIVLVVFAIERLFNPTPVNGPMMLFLGIIGLLVNLVLGFVLGHSHGHHGHDHSHGGHDHIHGEDEKSTRRAIESDNCSRAVDAHNHENGHVSVRIGVSEHDRSDDDIQGDHFKSHNGAHQHDSENRQKPSWKAVIMGRDKRSVNLRAAYLHVLGDALQNIGVILAAIVLTTYPALSFVDPLCTLIFAVIVVTTTKGLARETMTVLMEGTPPSVHLDDIHAQLARIDGVSRIGDLHAWSITARRPALSVHLYQRANVRSHDLVKGAQKLLSDKFGIHHATIQVNCDTSECCNNELYFEAGSCEKNCMSYNNT